MASDFDSVGKFHAKFGLPASDGVAREIGAELRDFRLKFLLEELEELAEGYGLRLEWELHGLGCGQDLPKIADSLVDLVYVTLGTAHLHGLPWGPLFAEVQRANMAKERARPDGSDSARGSSFDVVKPASWRPPAVIETLMKAGWKGPRLPSLGEKE
jgi:hypothetical protein